MDYVVGDDLSTAPSNNEQVSASHGEGFAFSVGGDFYSDTDTALTMELELTALLYEDAGDDLYLSTSMLNITYNHFFDEYFYIGAGGGLGLGMANVDRDINDLGFGFAYQGVIKAGMHFWDKGLLIGIAYRFLGYTDIKFDDSTIVEAGNNNLISVEATLRF